MAELATIARPYAEALFEAAATQDAKSWRDQVAVLAEVASNPAMHGFSDDPTVSNDKLAEMILSVAGLSGSSAAAPGVVNLLRTVIENGRLAALPEIAHQFRQLQNERDGVADALIDSAFPMNEAAIADLVGTLERRFGKKLIASVQVRPELIGGVRVQVGDEVLDTSVQGQLERMKNALTA
jgi:F-type H+-transporting ATPase subunit delta